MLRYLNCGARSGPNPHPLGLKRGNWEFYAVVQGAMRPVYPDGKFIPAQESRLWLMPPESRHGWCTPTGQTSRVFVFHFASIHPQLERAMPSRDALSISIGAKEKRLLARLFSQLRPHYLRPMICSTVQFEIAMLQLCMLMLERSREISNLVAFDAGSEKVMQAVQWHHHHFSDGISVKKVAAALCLSPGHLRRLFLEQLGATPKKVFMRATMDEACRLLARDGLSFKEIAVQCGFAGCSEFHRAFKKHTGQSPTIWRANPLSVFKPALRTRTG